MTKPGDENEALSARTEPISTDDDDGDLSRKIGAALRSRGRRRLPIAEVTSEPAPMDWQVTPISALTDDERSQAFEIVRRCRSMISDIKPRRPATLLDYAKKHRQLESQRRDDETATDLDLWKETLLPYVAAPRSFRAYKAALCCHWELQIQDVLAQQAAIQREGGDAFVWLDLLGRLRPLEDLLQGIRASRLDSPEWADLGIQRREASSKERDLAILSSAHPNWLGRTLLAMRRTKYLEQVRVLSRCGSRPVEFLEGGVRVMRGERGTFRMKVIGAKVRDHAGQPWRLITLSDALLPAAWARRLRSEEGFDVVVESVAALRESLRRVSERLFPGMPAVTPYSFRHAVASQWRAQGASETDVGGSLGHAVSETQEDYGHKPPRGKRRKPAKVRLISVETARPVRPRSQVGLQQLGAQGRLKQQKAKGQRTTSKAKSIKP